MFIPLPSLIRQMFRSLLTEDAQKGGVDGTEYHEVDELGHADDAEAEEQAQQAAYSTWNQSRMFYIGLRFKICNGQKWWI